MSLWQHPGNGLLCDQKGPERGDLQCTLDLGRNEFDEGSARARAGVVDDHVRRAVFAVDVSEQSLHLRLVLGVAGERAGTSFGAQRRKFRGVARGNCDGETLFPEQPGERRAQSPDRRRRSARTCRSAVP